jgi:hypothetical protein
LYCRFLAVIFRDIVVGTAAVLCGQFGGFNGAGGKVHFGRVTSCCVLVQQQALWHSLLMGELRELLGGGGTVYDG